MPNNCGPIRLLDALRCTTRRNTTKQHDTRPARIVREHERSEVSAERGVLSQHDQDRRDDHDLDGRDGDGGGGGDDDASGGADVFGRRRLDAAAQRRMGHAGYTPAVEATNTCDNSGRRRSLNRCSPLAKGTARDAPLTSIRSRAEAACLRHVTVEHGPEHTSERAVSGAGSEAGRRGAEWEHGGIACSMG